MEEGEDNNDNFGEFVDYMKDNGKELRELFIEIYEDLWYEFIHSEFEKYKEETREK